MLINESGEEMKIPSKLEIVPILEAIYEIRFDTDSPEETNTGVIYSCFKDDFENVENFPIMNLPSQLRNSEKELMYSPYQKMKSKDGTYILQYGQRQFSLHCVDYSYDVFENFKTKINEVSNKLLDLEIISSVKRLGLRYTDFLNDENIPGYTFDDLNLQIDIANMNRGENFSCSALFMGKTARHRTQIYNSIEIEHKEIKKSGDLIDLDSFVEDENINIKNVEDFVSNIHQEQKEIFFGILGEKVTKLLGPTYE